MKEESPGQFTSNTLVSHMEIVVFLFTYSWLYHAASFSFSLLTTFHIGVQEILKINSSGDIQLYLVAQLYSTCV